MVELAEYLSAPTPTLRSCSLHHCRARQAARGARQDRGTGRSGPQVQIQRKELEPWLVQRAKAAGLDLTPPAARVLVETLGEDIGQLAAALEQLQGAFQGEQVTPTLVHRQFRGLGEQKSWDLCDRAFGKDLPGAIRSLRSIEEGGDDALMVLGAIAARLRDLMRVRALPDRLPPAQLAKQAGLRFEWQARRYQQQARNFSLEQLVSIHAQVAETDLALKSGAPGDVVMPVLIASIAA
jgi:DNA polymerase-3 subunit delta